MIVQLILMSSTAALPDYYDSAHTIGDFLRAIDSVEVESVTSTSV